MADERDIQHDSDEVNRVPSMDEETRANAGETEDEFEELDEVDEEADEELEEK